MSGGRGILLSVHGWTSITTKPPCAIPCNGVNNTCRCVHAPDALIAQISNEEIAAVVQGYGRAEGKHERDVKGGARGGPPIAAEADATISGNCRDDATLFVHASYALIFDIGDKNV